MLHENFVSRTSSLALIRQTFVFLILAAMLVLSGCGSTKVYTANKTIVYGGTIYNMSTVQRIGSRVEGVPAEGDMINMRTLDKKGVEALLKENSSVVVSAIVEMDGQEMVYRRKGITKYSEYSNMMKSFDRALNDITKFMADKKKTQLKLN